MSVMELRVKAPKPKTSKGFLKCSARREMELMKTHQVVHTDTHTHTQIYTHTLYTH